MVQLARIEDCELPFSGTTNGETAESAIATFPDAQLDGKELSGTFRELEAKLLRVRDFIEGRDDSTCNPSNIDATASSIGRLLAAFDNNPYVILDRTGTEPREIRAPEDIWGSISKTSYGLVLDLHGPKGTLELSLSDGEKDDVIHEIAVFRRKSA